ncbi:PTS fructose transporter subunit IIC [Haloarchaeobius sp. HRN-SO-5]|uniref:PTS fructose transporter subunit IIC n=1 Tax=Haloarchaeobius sp. HRN-SO-5 TaxID=3446118 RepID=UPI003EBBDB94
MAAKDTVESALRSHVTSVKEDLMTGVSFMIPFVTIGGIFIALGFAATEFVPGTPGIKDFASQAGTLDWYLAQIGGAGLTFMVPILGAYIAYAIADRPALAPAFILSYIVQQGPVIEQTGQLIGLSAGGKPAGYLGAIAVGLLTGYVVRWFKNQSVPKAVEPMMPILVIPVFATAILTPIVLFVLGVPVAIANDALTSFLGNMQGGTAILLGAILGAMMAFDMGGPVNKVAYLFSVGLLGAEGGPVTEPMAAVMIAGMTPPIGMALSNFIAPHKYAEEMYEQAKSSIVMGLSFITEGAIPYAAADPLRVIPSIMFGSAVAAAMSMGLGVGMPAPHGGIFVFLLSNQWIMFVACILVGSLVTAGTATAVKPDYDERIADSTTGAEAEAQVND